MDEQVRKAMQKWPDVPAVYGWLSLSAQGRWLLHQNGEARAGTPGEAIANEQIRVFMDRNYAANERGEWYFQNGPQRVFVDLASAPFIVRIGEDGQSLITHNHLPITHVDAWYLDPQGALYMQTEYGAAMLAGRDAAAVTERLRIIPAPEQGPASETGRESAQPLGEAHLVALENGATLQVALDGAAAFSAPMRWCDDSRLPATLGFVRQPEAK